MDRLQSLTREKCLSLLRTKSLGRVAYTKRALPAIRPVNYAVVGHHIVLQTQAGGLGRRLDGQIVAFEVDDMDGDRGTGWSVVVTGTARLLLNPGELIREFCVPVFSLVGEGHDARVCIVPGVITGRRIRAPDVA